MGLTISWNSPTLRQGTPGKGIESSDWRALGEGLGGLQRWSQKQKAADLMEGKAKAMDRIKAIDAEIAELEGQLQGFEEKRAADTLAARRRAAAEEGMQGYVPAEAGRPTDVPQVSPQFTTDPYQDQYLATQQALAAQPPQPNRSYQYRLSEPEQLSNAFAAQAAQRKYRWGR